MKQTSGPTKKAPAGAVLKDIRRATKRQFSAEEKIRIVLLLKRMTEAGVSVSLG